MSFGGREGIWMSVDTSNFIFKSSNFIRIFVCFFVFCLFFFSGRRKDLLLLAASKENTRDLSQSSVSPTAKVMKFFLFVF